MSHYICTGTCGGVLSEVGFCETEHCPAQWTMMHECTCTDGLHGKAPVMPVAYDANGTVLQTGDSVTLIKDLPVKGSPVVLKRGTKAVSIRLTENPEEIDCKLNGTAIVLRTEFVKKL
jgi:alkylphosphonate utilization operon protein PhnA